MKWNQSILLLLIVVVSFGCIAKQVPQPSLPSDATPPPEISHPMPAIYTYAVVNSYPHDQDAFTQGLVLEKGVVYEGTGLYGRSTLRRVELKTGRILQLRELPAHYFGEGVTVCGNKVFQLTWQSGTGFVYDKDSFELVREFHYPYEGWGLTYDGRYLVMSDGTALLYFLDPETFNEIRRVEVYDTNGTVTQLNE